ncbi:hypothetical protein ABPG75_013562 [Micractinium tetrahymenae]
MPALSLAASGVLAAGLAVRGLQKGSLSPSGAAAAALVGFLHMAASFECGTTLIIFYLTSSKLTKWRSDLKARLEAGHAEGGRRGAGQVLANSAIGAALAAASAWLRAGGSTTLLGWPVSLPALAYGFVGFYACCCADTWSSEVGIAARAPPRLVTSWRRVPPGTNGGVSALGTAAAAAGGALVGCVFLVAARLPRLLGLGIDGLDGGSAGSAAEACWHQASTDWQLLPLALVSGLAGSLLDSLLGATLQLSLYDERSRKAVSARSAAVVDHAGPGSAGGKPAPQLKRVCGSDVLSNTGVNVCSSVLTAALVAAVGPRLLPPCLAAA